LDGTHGKAIVNKTLALLASGLALATTLATGNAAATDDVANGRKLYIGSPNASYPGGSAACNQCHDVNDTGSEMNRLFRGAAGDPGLIDFAINSNSDSSGDMKPLYGFGAPFELSDSDESDLAAYIDSVVNPGGGGPTAPAFSVTPGAKDFGSVAIGGNSGTNTITVSNTGGSGTLSLIASSNNTEFLVAGGSCLPAPKSLGPSASCTISISFAPATAGARTSTLTIGTNGSPPSLTVNLTGTGSTGAPAAGQLNVPASYAFSSQAVGVQSAAHPITVTNIGGSTVAIASVSDSNTPEFPVTANNCNGASLVAGASCSISVAFRPGTAGVRSGTLTIASNGSGSPQTIALSGSGTSGGPTGGTKVVVGEFYNAGFDHYFITLTGPNTEGALLGIAPFQDWQPTGRSFNAYSPTAAPAAAVAVCRFFNTSFAPKSSHFYALRGLGCEDTIASFPDWGLESDDVFKMLLPDVNGNCPSGSVPVYRLYNNGMGGAPNLADRQAMLDKGYASEGFGALGVGMCSPQ
jgi:cytochrome c553